MLTGVDLFSSLFQSDTWLCGSDHHQYKHLNYTAAAFVSNDAPPQQTLGSFLCFLFASKSFEKFTQKPSLCALSPLFSNLSIPWNESPGDRWSQMRQCWYAETDSAAPESWHFSDCWSRSALARTRREPSNELWFSWPHYLITDLILQLIYFRFLIFILPLILIVREKFVRVRYLLLLTVTIYKII